MRAFWDQSEGGRNFGDALTAVLLERLAGVRLEWSPPETAELFGIGSSAEAIPADFTGYVLGTGKMFAHTQINLAGAKVLALRGKLTAKGSGAREFKPLLADLGLLAADLAPKVERDIPLGWIPHYVDERMVGHRIDILAGIDEVIAEAARCQRIASSSLHGIILADALGIENCWDPHPDVMGDGFKFRDYASAFGETIEPGVWRLADQAKVATKQAALRKVIAELVTHRTVFLVPRRADRGHRDRLWAWCKSRWEALMPDVPIYEGHHTDGPFNRSAAINEAARLADLDGRWDVGIVIDSDVFLPIPSVRAAVERARAGYVTWAHRRWREISEDDTLRLIRDPDTFGETPAHERDMDLIVSKTTPISWSCCVAIPREAFDAMGGFDERFRGWGFEDGAWAALVRGLYPWDRIEGDLYTWWHPRSPERIVLGESASTASKDYIRNALLGRRYMVAAIRDHRAGDQPGEQKLSDDLAKVHIANLTADDARFLTLARQKGMPEVAWRDWWPSLEELQTGVMAGVKPGVTVAIRSGGAPEMWEERSEYLRESIASLSGNVSGPIVQRVIYSDWGTDHLADLTAIGEPHGFYVVGPAKHMGYRAAVQHLWRYLASKARGEYVFLAEDDFIYSRDVDLEPMIATLRDDPNLAQIALLRAAYYPRETEVGGVLESLHTALTPIAANGHSRIEHRDHWTMNPCLVRRSVTAVAWPSRDSSERVFGDTLLRDPQVRFAYWGAGEPWIEHIGELRAVPQGAGY